jgi:hypothetical protein
MKNGRCRMHGGLTPRGPALPQFKHGKYSKAFPRDVRVAYQRVRSNPNLLCLKEDVAVLETKQRAVLARMDEQNPPPWGEAVKAFNDFKTAGTDEKKQQALAKLGEVIRSGAGDAADREGLWREFRELAQEKAVLIKGERNWLAKLRSMYTAEQGIALQHAVIESAKQTFGDDPEKLAQFIDGVLSMFDEPKRIEAEQE